jgi:hypothetical protein
LQADGGCYEGPVAGQIARGAGCNRPILVERDTDAKVDLQTIGFIIGQIVGQLDQAGIETNRVGAGGDADFLGLRAQILLVEAETVDDVKGTTGRISNATDIIRQLPRQAVVVTGSLACR